MTSLGMMLTTACLAVAVTAAQDRGAALFPGSDSSDTPHLRLKTTGAGQPIAPGARVSLFVEVDPKPSMHVYAPGQKQYLPVSLRLERTPQVTARPPIFPKGEVMVFAPTREMSIAYSQPFRIEVPVTVAAGQPPGPITLTGTLEYQACDDRVCYLPKKVPVSWTLTVR